VGPTSRSLAQVFPRIGRLSSQEDRESNLNLKYWTKLPKPLQTISQKKARQTLTKTLLWKTTPWIELRCTRRKVEVSPLNPSNFALKTPL